MNFDLERFIRFAAVAEEKSFTRAAHKLQVDQPWLSRQVRQLEEQLGFALLRRTTRRVELTPEGEALLEHARQLTAIAEQTRAFALSLRREKNRHLRIGIAPTTFWVRKRHETIDFFKRKNETAEIEMVTAVTPALLTQLSRRLIDVAIGATCDGAEDFERILLHRVTPRLLVPNRHSLATKAKIYMSDLAGETLATTDRSVNPFGYDQLYEPFFDAGAVPRVVVEGRVAMPFYAQVEHFLLIDYHGDTARTVIPDYISRIIEDCPIQTETWVFRNREEHPELVRRFWAIAKHIGAKDLRRNNRTISCYEG